LPEPTVETDARHAVDVIADAAAEAPLTLIAVGPLTNVALALRRRPSVASRIERVVLMGGAIGLGNWTPSAEFNIWFDPEAAEAAFSSGLPVTMVPLEVTHQALATPDVVARVDALDTPVARMTSALLRYFASTYERVFSFPAPAVHDPCAVARVIDPSLAETRPMRVSVETHSELTRGRTDCDVHGIRGQQPNAEVAVALDAPRFWDLMVDALATYR
jgi:inosine-uridine nucleoside N-ribohydrolase